MDQLLIVSIIVFCAVVLAIQASYWLLSERRQSTTAVNRRLSLSQQSENARETFESLRRERNLLALESGRLQFLNRFVTQTGLRLNDRTLSIFGFLLSLTYFGLFGMAVGFGPLSLVIALVLSLATLLGIGVVIRRRRIGRFAQQLPDAIDVIVRGLRAGYPFVVAMALVAKEMPDPIGSEFGLTTDEMTFGSDVTTALENLYVRVGEDELTYVTMAIKVQSETGGNLAEVLSRLSNLMRARAILKLKVRSITAEGRLSGLLLSVTPLALFGVITLLKPDYYSGVTGDPVFWPSVVGGCVLLAVGNLVMYKMVNFKV